MVIVIEYQVLSYYILLIFVICFSSVIPKLRYKFLLRYDMGRPMPIAGIGDGKINRILFHRESKSGEFGYNFLLQKQFLKINICSIIKYKNFMKQ